MQNQFLIAPVYVLLFSLILFQNSNALDYKAYGFIQPEITSFFNGDGRHNQSNKNFSAFAKGTFVTYLNNNNTKITVNSIGRIDDNDDNRTYIDFQKLKYELFFNDITFRIGNELIFWGVNESFNIVDLSLIHISEPTRPY